MYNFKLDAWELKKYQDWRATHYRAGVCKYFDDGTQAVSPQGAIGGRETFSFTPTGIGTVIHATCACGADVNLTNYEVW
jgi:hypothetical protein